MRRAERELNETPTRRKNSTAELRKLVMGEKRLFSRLDDSFLLRFLRVNKFDVNAAFQHLRRYYAFRHYYSKLIAPSPVRYLPIYRDTVNSILTTRDVEGRRIYVFRIENWDTSTFDAIDLFNSVALAAEHDFDDDVTQIAGVVDIMDFKGLGFTHISKFTPYFLKLGICFLQDIFPARYHEFHVINQPYVFNILYNIAYPLLNPSIRSKIFLHGSNYTSLQHHVDPEVLPREFEGHKPAINNSALITEIMAWESTWRLHRQYGYKFDSTSDIQSPHVKVCQ
jgi:hypothetical protein